MNTKVTNFNVGDIVKFKRNSNDNLLKVNNYKREKRIDGNTIYEVIDLITCVIYGNIHGLDLVLVKSKEV